MKFDVVCGNPPYNNDMYLDFVMRGHRLAKTYDLWITPAKFMFRSDESNKAAKNLIKNNIEKITFYTDCCDIFNIGEIGGIAYYLVNKLGVDNVSVQSISLRSKVCNCSTVYSNIDCIKTLDIYADSIINKVSNAGKFKFINNPKADYAVASSIMPAIGGGKSSGTYIFSNDGNLQFLAKYHYDLYNRISELSSNYRIMFSGSSNECNSFISYIECRFIRFLLFVGKCSNSVMCIDTWRFVPDPVSFDKIYEDKPLVGYIPDENGEYIDADGNKHCSLYIKYNLTDEEINIIESVIRERK